MTLENRSAALRELLHHRSSLVGQVGGTTNCVRLCAGLADGIEGMLVDRFGPLILVVDYSEPTEPTGETFTARGLLGLLQQHLPNHYVVAKVRATSDGANGFSADFAAPGAGLAAGEVLQGHERGLIYEIGTDPAHDFGIFLDAAKARAFVRTTARGKRVLNLFSYAGAFGIAAAAGGAADVVNVDPNRTYLAWSLRNAALNGVNMRVLPDTTQDFLGKHLRRLGRNPQTPGFDLVVVDPPAFCVGRGDERLMRLLWPQIFDALRIMKPQQVLLLCNDKYFRNRQSFPELVQMELGSLYSFSRLGTCFTANDLSQENPVLTWTPSVEDPHYLEPVVLAGALI